jgi:hypothetical protein
LIRTLSGTSMAVNTELKSLSATREHADRPRYCRGGPVIFCRQLVRVLLGS